MAIMGLRGTGSYGTGERPKSFRELILWEEPNGKSPLTALMAKMGSEKLSDPEFNWWQERQQLVRIQLNGAIADGVDTTFVCDAADATHPFDARALVPNDVYMLETADGSTNVERVIIASVQSATAFTVVRGAAGSTPAAIADGAWLMRIGSAFAEGSSAAASVSTNPVKQYNLAQIFKTSYAVTKTDALTTHRTGDPLKNERKRKMFQHAVNMEMAYIFGLKHESIAANGQPLRLTGGIISQLATNVKQYNNTTRKFQADTFMADVSRVFDYDAGGAGSERLVLIGNGALRQLQLACEAKPNSQITFAGGIQTYGMDFQKVVTPQGTFYFKTHPLFNTHPVHTYSMLVLNPKGLLDRYLRKTTFEDNIQLPGDDFHKGQWLTESGPEVHFEGSHAYLSNCIYTA